MKMGDLSRGPLLKRLEISNTRLVMNGWRCLCDNGNVNLTVKIFEFKSKKVDDVVHKRIETNFEMDGVYKSTTSRGVCDGSNI